MQLTFSEVLSHQATLLLSLALYTAQIRLSLHCLLNTCALYSATLMGTSIVAVIRMGAEVRSIGSTAALLLLLRNMPLWVHTMTGVSKSLPEPRREAS